MELNFVDENIFSLENFILRIQFVHFATVKLCGNDREDYGIVLCRT